MPALPISGSPNITELQSRVRASLCDGNFYVDVTPSVFTAEGISTSGGVQGASVRITNPVGVVIDEYPTSGFDIYPPMTSIYSFAIPLIAGIYQYGTYTIDVRLTDEDGTEYTVTKTVNICPPDPNNKNRNYGCINATMQANCVSGRMLISLDAPPNYKGTQFTSQVNDLELEYPTASGLPVLETTLGSFGVQVYEGQYKLTGTVCALYSYGDEVYFNVNYKVKCEKIVYCIIDECCVQAKLKELWLKIKSDCTQAEKDATFAIFVEGNALLDFAKLTAQCGEDPSETIADLEELLGCRCTCNCNEGTPIIGNSAGATFLYRGILTQVGTAIPTAQVSELNTVTITWTRTSAGVYIGTVTGLPQDLTEANTFAQINSSSFIQLSPFSQSFIKAGYNSANSIYVRTNDIAGTAADALLKNIPIELSII